MTLNSKTKSQLIQYIKELENRLNQNKTELNEPELSYHAIFNSIDDLLFYKNSESRYLGCNQAFADFAGKKREEIIGKTDYDIFPAERAIVYQNKDKIVLEKNNTISYEDSVDFLDGQKRVFQIRKSTMLDKDGKVIGIIGISRDITEEKSIRKRNEEIQFGIDHSQIGVFQVDHEGNINYVNKHACKSLGYTETELLKMSVIEIDPNFNLNQWKKHRELLSFESNTIESSHKRKDGSTFPVEVTINFLEYDKKKLSFSFVRDISDRKEAEKKLQKKNTEQSLLLDSLDFQVWFLRDLETYGMVNEAHAKFLGYKKEELENRKFSDFLPFEVASICRTGNLDVYQKKTTIRTEEWAKNNKGELRLLEITKTPKLDEQGNVEFVVCVASDLTQIRKAEAVNRETEIRYKLLLNNLNDAVLVYPYKINGFGKFTEVNDIACEMYGYTREEFLQLTIPNLRQPLEAQTQKMQEQMKEIFQQGRFVFEAWHVTKDGKAFPVEVSSNLIKVNEREFVLSVVRNISTRKQLEEQVQQAQKMEAVGQLAGGIAHDFNNLLTVIGGYCDLLLMKNMPVEYELPVKQIHNASTRAARMTGQLLAFSRKQVIQPKIINLNNFITDGIKMLRRLLGENMEISTNFSAELGNIKFDPGQLDQVIINIAVNARDAMPNGGVLTLETSNTPCYENRKSKMNENCIQLKISDTGTGMDETVLSRIFEPFFTTKGLNKGTGLGLATVYGIIKQNNGSIHVESSPGTGTTFYISFPMVESKEIDDIKKKVNTEDIRGTETILLVEDNADVRMVTQSTLTSFGYSVLTATNGEEAIRIYKEKDDTINLVLTDVVMPIMTGSELAEKLLQLDSTIKIIFFSGYSDNYITDEGVLQNGVEFIQKPYTNIDMVRKIRDSLDKPVKNNAL